ncbi:uncharacterized protein PRCAT00006309001 [Priceomyces carsonii]|uniref:uncharacterized protein n=1 Tax=Priceomyces carsonii TaxID=28549 RepID=UPI002ED7BB06|nr:unnamed protein product [Priceomyces carsonii]
MEQVNSPGWEAYFLHDKLSFIGTFPIGFNYHRNKTVDEIAFINEPIVNSDNLAEGWLTCSDSLEGWGPLSTRFGDFTPCTFQGILCGFTALMMILVGSYQIYYLRGKKKSIGNRVTWSFYAKLILVTIQLVFQVATYLSYTSTDIIKLALLMNVFATVVSLAIHYLEQFKSRIPNGVLIFYWFVQTLLGLGKICNLKLRNSIHTSYALLTVFATVTSFLILLMEINFPMQPLVPFNVKVKVSPVDKANLFSRLTFRWLDALMKKGYMKYLTARDLPPLPKDLKSENTYSRFRHFWDLQTKKSLFKAVGLSIAAQFAVAGVFKAAQDILANVQPHLLRLLIEFVNDYTEAKKNGHTLPLTRGLFIAGGMFIVSVTQTACLHQYFQRAFDVGMKIRSSLIALVYNKSLILSNETKQESNTGDIVNLMSVDVQRLLDLAQNLQVIWSGPFQITMCLYSLHGLLGNAMWAGVVIMIIMIPLNATFARYQKKLQKSQMKFKDERSRLISEILNNIKSLKLYAWENPYLSKLNIVRNEKELRNLKKMGIFSAVINFSLTLAPTLVSCSTFAIFVLVLKKSLTTDIVFPALSLFNLLNFPLAVLPMVITNIIESQVSVDRLYKFLTADELQPDSVIRDSRTPSKNEPAVSIQNGTFLWSKVKSGQNLKIALEKINLQVKKGELDCIVGKVGSGKSSMLQAMLGNLYKLEGQVKLKGKVAYVPQSPWIMNGTVRENILFGHKYDPNFYDLVLRACALTIDLSTLPNGDKTEVGEKGISLSGGQKARLSLARAVYARADVYLMDDPLSAVDEHVRKHLIDNVIGPRGLLKSKCRILATNSIGVLSDAHKLHLLKDGKLIEQGTYYDIMKQEDSQLRKLILEFGSKKSDSDDYSNSSEEGELVEENKDALESLDSVADIDSNSLRRASEVTLSSDEEYSIEGEEEESSESKSRRETMQQGKVKWSVYKAYGYACNPTGVIAFVSMCVLGMFDNIAASFWLKHWSEVNSKYGGNPHIWKYLGIYFFLGMAYSIILLVQNCVMWLYCTINASKKLHTEMAHSVLRAPMSFFETTPIGRILNRFSSDVFKLDEIVGRLFAMFISNAVKVTLTIGVIAFSTWPIIFLLVPLSVLYIYYQQYYLKTSRELKRLESVSRSPIYANFQESLNGVTTIRAYGQEHRFKALNESKVDKNTSANHPSMSANRWLAVRLEFLGSLIILGASGLSILNLDSGRITAGMIGISVSYALQITQSLNWIVRMSVDVENNIVSVERILEYSKLKPEAPEIIEDHRPPTVWPLKGEISFNNYSTKYRPELDLVLKNINLSVKSKEKIGIVGRTGAGKSSMTLALFRIIEKVSGDIVIDDIETSTIGLRDLRERLSIIPQDSQVFEGSIRSNLDPTNIFTDDQLWRALELSHLKDHVNKMYNDADDVDDIESPLYVRVSEGGSNLSAGQKQLMCLARVLLKLETSNILVLDEATAAVDVETDQILQQTIRTEFKEKTIITIAHRLNTIIDSDKIIVLEKGEVKEFDSPENLLKDSSSLFYSLCKQGGFVE